MPRPNTRTRHPAVRSGGSPSTINAARPLAGRHAAPRRAASTASTHSLDGRWTAACAAPLRSGSMTGADRRRGDSSTIPSTATGCGDDVRLQARSSKENRFDRIADQPAAPPTTATKSMTAAHPYRPRPTDTAHATNATAAADHQTTGERSTTAGRPQPVATATATATSGRSGSGSFRTKQLSQSAHE